MIIIRDFQPILAERLRSPLNFIQVVLGPRQVGKTTGVRAVFEAYEGPKHFASADSPVPLNAEWLHTQWGVARNLGENALLVVDEVQKVLGWEETVKLLFDKVRASRKMKVVLLGSASLSIQEGLSGVLAGRFELIKVHHWDHKECKKGFGWDFTKYLKFGGYPAAVELLPDLARWQSYVRDSIIEPVLGRDISGLVRINNPSLFRQTFKLVLQYPAQVVSYQKLLGQLQERGNASTVKHYLELLEGAFLIKRLEKFTGSSVARTHSMPKLIPMAPALCNAFLEDLSKLDDPIWIGRIFEAVVATKMLALPGTLYYWSEGSYELDLVRVIDGKIIAYEVKAGLSHRAKSHEVFKRKFPKAVTQIMDPEIFQLL